MCGIDVEIFGTRLENLGSDDKDVIGRRGPHGSIVVTRTLCSGYQLSMRATVLHVRGENMKRQPVPIEIVDEEHYLCWNGEAYEILNKESDDIVSNDLSAQSSRNNAESDTAIVAQMLKEGIQDTELNEWVWRCSEEQAQIEHETTINFDANLTKPDDDTPSPNAKLPLRTVAAVMARIWNGEFTFCFSTPDALYYGRDSWGRRSLLVASSSSSECADCKSDDIFFKLASVATSTRGEKWSEVPPGRVYELELATGHVRSLALPSVRPTTLPISVSSSLSYPPPPSGVSANIWKASFALQQHLTRAVASRVYTNHTKASSVGILFSGGLDSVVLASLACEVLQQQQQGTVVELFNVNFGPKESADRKAAIQSMKELKTLYPHFPLKLICVDTLEWQDVVQHDSHLLQLIHPKHTAMDLNIGTALWFASRGVGYEWVDQDNGRDQSGAKNYTSSCRIVLVGMGADEQMGGYGRHRKCFATCGEEGLQAELDRDIHRLWERNLGRDDRAISDHGREARFPFLDVHVTDFLRNLPVSEKCNMNLEPGVGDKQILRLIAHRLGLVTAGGLVKRAIQFGSRMAHMSDTKRFNSRRKASGEAEIPVMGTN